MRKALSTLLVFTLTTLPLASCAMGHCCQNSASCCAKKECCHKKMSCGNDDKEMSETYGEGCGGKG